MDLHAPLISSPVMPGAADCAVSHAQSTCASSHAQAWRRSSVDNARARVGAFGTAKSQENFSFAQSVRGFTSIFVLQ